MVAMSTSLAYRSFELDSIATVRAGNLRAWAISQASPEKRNFSGLDLEKQIAPPVEAELFLDIPFYRTQLTQAGATQFSMSSIRRDVKKKAPPRPGEILSRDPAHSVS